MLDRLRLCMQKNDIDYFAVFSEDPHLSEYTAKTDKYREALSGFTGSAGILLVGTDESYLWTDSRYFVQASAELENSGISLMKYGLPGVLSFEDYLTDHIWEGQTVAFDFKSISYDRYKKIQERLPQSTCIIDGYQILREAIDDLPKRSFSDIEAVPDDMAGKSVLRKIEDARKAIRKKYVQEGSYSYILSDLASIMWLLNLRGNDIEHVPVAYAYAIITEYTTTVYLSRKSLSDNERALLEENQVTVKEYSRFYKEIDDIATDIVLADPLKNNSRILIGFDEQGILKNCHDHKIITKAVKNTVEREGMKKAHLQDAATMIRFIKLVKELASQNKLPDEYDLGRILDDMRLNNGCSSVSFDTICAYGSNSAIVHYTAKKDSAKKLQQQGFLLVDSGGQYKNLGTTDITRTISLGQLTEQEKKVYTTTLLYNTEWNI